MDNEYVIKKVIDIQKSPQKDYLKELDVEYGKTFYLKPIIFLAIGVGLFVVGEFFVNVAATMLTAFYQAGGNGLGPNITKIASLPLSYEWYVCGAICFLIGSIASIFYSIKQLFRE
jgi:hypothetical protein